jgi:hypothetical protein
MGDKVIMVNFGKGLATVEPNSKGADFGDTIIWQSKCPFVIHFKGTSPVNKMIIHSRKEGNIHTADAKVVHDSEKFGGIQGKYFIACANEEYIDAADPDIIVPRDRRR